MNNIKNKKGFALLFAVLISGLLITIGISIFNISIKELMISASIRDSQTAYYAADSAAECFFYWDTISDYFNYCESEPCTSDTDSIKCNENIISVNKSGNNFTSEKFIRYSNDPNDTLEPVASMNITKTKYSGLISTDYSFKGYNTGETGRRVERAYRIISD
jgi:hypothetical protein